MGSIYIELYPDASENQSQPVDCLAFKPVFIGGIHCQPPIHASDSNKSRNINHLDISYRLKKTVLWNAAVENSPQTPHLPR